MLKIKTKLTRKICVKFQSDKRKKKPEKLDNRDRGEFAEYSGVIMNTAQLQSHDKAMIRLWDYPEDVDRKQTFTVSRTSSQSETVNLFVVCNIYFIYLHDKFNQSVGMNKNLIAMKLEINWF